MKGIINNSNININYYTGTLSTPGPIVVCRRSKHCVQTSPLGERSRRGTISSVYKSNEYRSQIFLKALDSDDGSHLWKERGRIKNSPEVLHGANLSLLWKKEKDPP